MFIYLKDQKRAINIVNCNELCIRHKHNDVINTFILEIRKAQSVIDLFRHNDESLVIKELELILEKHSYGVTLHTIRKI